MMNDIMKKNSNKEWYCLQKTVTVRNDLTEMICFWW